MKFSEQWLREWVNPAITAQQMADELTMSGLEIESVTPVANEFSNVVIGLVLEAIQHPNADRLRVCKVDVGQTEPLNIVCGGANVRANLKVPVAMVGAVLGKDFKIQSSKLRGVVSQGMICSTSELGLTETSEGIMELPDDAPIGQDIRKWLQLEDNLLDVHVTPNRGDCLSIAGLAREVAVLNNIDLISHKSKPIDIQINDQLPITVTDSKDCPRYCGRIIKSVNLKAATPLWMIERLRRSGIRSINPVVDVTNYVLLELGQPLHAFDLAKINKNIIVRLAEKSESIVLLDNQTVKLDNETLVIADNTKPLAIAGIMGGLDSSVTENTQDIFLESAYFNSQTIAGRARRYGLDTDSAYRFERGVDPELPVKALDRATELLLEITGGKAGPIAEIVDQKYLPKVNPIQFRPGRLTKVIGTEIETNKIELILKRLGMKVENKSEVLLVTPPSHRFDLSLEEDIIEEVVRIYGYQNIPEQAPKTDLKFLPNSEQQIPLKLIRNLLLSKDYNEAITYSFISPKLEQLIEPNQKLLSLSNPISADLSVMRSSLWPGLLNAVSYNQNRQQSRVRLFETGLVFKTDLKSAVTQESMLAGIIAGDSVLEQWGIAKRPVDFFDLKGDVEALLNLTGHSKKFSFKQIEHPALHPGQSSGIFYKQELIGYLGALHPSLFNKLDLQGPVYLFEIKLDILTKASLPEFKNISKFPAIRRDISFLIKQTINLQEIFDLINHTAGDLLIDQNVFDVYQGKGVEPGFRSLALGLIWQHPERTLVDEEVNSQMEKVITALKDKFKITLRD